VYVRKIINQNIRVMLRELFAAPAASRDRNRASAERFPASDIARCVADNVDLVRGKFASVLLFGASAGKFTEFIPIVVVVRKSAELKEMPDAIVAELQLRPA